MKARWLAVTSGVVLATFTAHAQHVPRAGESTELDRYVREEDASYQWRIAEERQEAGNTVLVVDLTSQNWRTSAEVDRTEWKHWLTIVAPPRVRAPIAMLYISGGSNGRDAPDQANPALHQVAVSTGTVVAELRMVPNQPLVFHGDGRRRVEDDLIAYTWDQYLKTGDSRWPAQLPMVKSAVRAMDAVQEVMASRGAGATRVEQFVVTGASKRGWTTWLTAAVDSRVAAIIPIVIDVLNVDVSMRHHYSAYGFWSPAIDDYVRQRIPDRRQWPAYARLMDLVDPFAYRERLSLPKCIINATGDEFFLPDSSQFYYDELPGEKHLCYVPNAGHSLRGTDAMETLLAFYHMLVHATPRPVLEWTYLQPDSIRLTCDPPPQAVRLWQATATKVRDFRLDALGRSFSSRVVEPDAEGAYTARITAPEAGWTAYFLQCEFDVGAGVPLRLTSPVKVIPDTLPFADQEPPLLPE